MRKSKLLSITIAMGLLTDCGKSQKLVICDQHSLWSKFKSPDGKIWSCGYSRWSDGRVEFRWFNEEKESKP